MIKKKPKVSFVILNWNGLDDTKVCIESIRNIDYDNKELIVVDNGSAREQKEFLKNIKDIIFVNNPENLGFTGGHISGYKKCTGDYIAIINNDLVLDKNWLAECLKTMAKYPKAAVVGGRSYKWNAENPVYELTNDFYSYQTINIMLGNTRTHTVGMDEKKVDAISGAALLFKNDAIKEVGYFDNDFFAYYEENDLIARMYRFGYECYYNPRAGAWHKIAGSSAGGSESYFYFYQMFRNQIMFAFKNFDDFYLRKVLKNSKKAYLRSRIKKVFYKDVSASNTAMIAAQRWLADNKEKLESKRSLIQNKGHSYIETLREITHLDVTVIVTAYNYAVYLEECIDSVLSQSVLPKKIIIINDGSTDNTLEVLKKYKDNAIIEIINKKNEGVVISKNLGISKSNTHWTIFLDADDYLDMYYIEKHLKHANDGRYDVVYSDMRLFGATNDIFRARSYNPYSLTHGNYIHNSALINTTLLKQLGGYKKEMKAGLEDWELYLSLLEIGASFSHLPEPIFYYRQHGSSTTSRNKDAKNKEAQLKATLKQLHPSLYRKYSTIMYWPFIVLSYAINFLIHPYLFVVSIKSIPAAFLSFVRTILHKQRQYLESLD